MFETNLTAKPESMAQYYMTLPLKLSEDNITRLWIMSGLFLLAVLAVLIPANYFDTRLLDGAPVWAKPIKFSLSLAIHFFTLAILAQQIGRKYRTGIVLTTFGYAAVASMLLEQIYISVQAGRGRHSHFNIDTVFEMVMFNLMGVGALLLVSVSFILGIMIWKYGSVRTTGVTLQSNQGLRLGAILGLTLGSILTLIFAGYMSGGTSHLVGQTTADSQGLPIVGWSRTAGDLRVPHFLATHLLQILPLIGLACDRFKWPGRKIVIGSTLVLVSLSVALFVAAIAGKSVFPIFAG
jgi:hypothetical protein